MVFITHYWLKSITSWLLGFCLLLSLVSVDYVYAEDADDADFSQITITSKELKVVDNELYLTSNLELNFSPQVIGSLKKGVVINFIAQVEIERYRWYWSNATEKKIKRYIQLSYKPLLDQYQITVSRRPKEIGSLQYSLHFTNFSEAKLAMQRIYMWKLVDLASLDKDSSYSLYFNYFLDVEQLPSVMRIGGMWKKDWDIKAQSLAKFSFVNDQIIVEDK